MNATQALTRGVHHAGLTVPDLAATRRFFTDALGFQQVGEVADYPAAFLSDGSVMVTLWQAENPDSATGFDRRRNIGLHHLAFEVQDLDAVHQRLASREDVELEFAPEHLGDGPTRHLMCAIPGGIRVEFIAPTA
jgi:catechol 2,3-dioxygenase-like lactoylglutathione lyase family enzyme